MRPFNEGLWRLCTFVRSSHFPPSAVTKPISLEDERGTASGQLNTHPPVPQAVLPRRRRGTALASFSRNALEGYPSEGFSIGNITRPGQRHVGNHFPPQLHHRFHFLIICHELPKFGQTPTEDPANCLTPDRCVFRLTDGDVKILAIALPRLQSLQLGRVCIYNTCNTTIASLMSISIHCSDLAYLQIHFNTENIVGDIQHLLGESVGQDKTKCKLQGLHVGELPLELDSGGVEIVAMGLGVIFPHLTHITSLSSRGHCWYDLGIRMGL